MNPTTKKPPASDNVRGFQSTSKTHINNIRKPPYYNNLNLRKGDSLIVCTGSGAWQRAQLTGWLLGRKVILPPGDDPTAYDWRAASGQDVIIAGFGDLEPIGTIARLGGLLHAAPAVHVLYVPERGPMTRIDARKAVV